MTNRRLIITFQKGRGRDWTDYFPLFEKHIIRVLEKLTSTRMINTMRITVKMRKTELDRQGAGGYCIGWKDSKKSNGSKSKHFPICLHSESSLFQNLTALTHELMHAVQFAEGRLGSRYLKTHLMTYVTWRPKGHTGLSIRFPYWDHDPKRIGLGKDKEKVIIPWAERPWEIEAQKAESDLMFIARYHANRWASYSPYQFPITANESKMPEKLSTHCKDNEWWN
jgi:hypothetical protein